MVNGLTKWEQTSVSATPSLRHLYLYDKAGRLTRQQKITDPSGSPQTKTTTYEWDALERMTRARVVDESNTTTTLQYDYNAENLRVRRIHLEGATTKLYSYRGVNLESIKVDPAAGENDYVYTVAPGQIANVLERHHPDYSTGNTSSQYYQYNHRGDVVAVTDEDGDIRYGYHYDAFGNIIFDYNSGGGSAPTDDNILFTGKDWDADLELYYFNARWYNPGLGKWITVDPAGLSGGTNLYAFAGNNPIYYIDPTGRCPARQECIENAYKAFDTAHDIAKSALEAMLRVANDNLESCNKGVGLGAVGCINSCLVAALGGGLTYLLCMVACGLFTTWGILECQNDHYNDVSLANSWYQTTVDGLYNKLTGDLDVCKKTWCPPDDPGPIETPFPDPLDPTRRPSCP